MVIFSYAANAIINDLLPHTVTSKLSIFHILIRYFGAAISMVFLVSCNRCIFIARITRVIALKKLLYFNVVWQANTHIDTVSDEFYIHRILSIEYILLM